MTRDNSMIDKSWAEAVAETGFGKARPDNSPDDQPVDAAHTDPMLLKVLQFIEYCRTVEYTTSAGKIPDEALARRDIKDQADALYKKLAAIKWGVTASPVNQPDTLEEMLARVPENRSWEIHGPRDECYCILHPVTKKGKLDIIGGRWAIHGRGPTPRAALASALAKIGEVR